jgi:hypothetical protein
MPTILLNICHSMVRFSIDKGAEVDIIDERTFNKLKLKPKLVKCKNRLYAYNKDPIRTLGQFTTRVSSNYSNDRSITLVVTEGNSGNLISYETAILLNAMKRINSMIQQKETKWHRLYPELFTGKVGSFKPYQVKLHIDESVQPRQEKLRHVPFHLREKVEAEVRKMLEQDLIEPVNGPTKWISPIVPVPKKDTDEIRICSDARYVNKAILRERHVMPTVDDLIVKLNGAQVISKLYLKSGYHQMSIEEASRHVTAFCTHMGIFQYKRLNFGINASAELFQRAIEQVISGIEGVMNASDDIIVSGPNQETHDNRLNEVLKRLREAGLTLNSNKCEFSKDKLDFFGMHFSKNGISLQESKVQAIKNASAPTDKSEIRSLLGLANYCNMFVPELATTVNPLRQLLKTKDAKIKYSQVEKEALAVAWACEKFHLYLYGCEFDIITDCKAVELIYGNPKSKPKARIERWCLRLMPFKFNVINKPGDDNAADYISRHPAEQTSRSVHQEIGDRFINLISQEAIPKAISRQQLINATNDDHVLTQVKSMIQEQPHQDVGQYKNIKDELTTTSDFV